MFFDLNVPYVENDSEISNTLSFLSELGYSTVALSQSINGKLPPNPNPPPPPATVPKNLTILTRLNLTLSDPSQNARLTSLANAYSLVALRPTNDKSFALACTNLDCDIISLDFSVRLPFHFKFKTVAAAVARGVRLEICYGPGVTGSGLDARRNLIGNAAALIRATRGRGIIISSEARRALGVRAPADVINLACVWGLGPERGREAVSAEARKVVALAALKRRSWRGIVDVIHGGEKNVEQKPNKAVQEEPKDKKGATTNANSSQGNGVKRKAATEVDQTPADAEKQLSKREMRRRAKKAKLEAAGVQMEDITSI